MNGVIRWITEHPVAANLSMIVVLAVGLFSATTVSQITFPEVSLDRINISVQYNGASPSEIETSIIRPIEQQLSGIDGIDEMTGTAREGSGSITLTFLAGVDAAERLGDVQTEIDRITTFPEDAEEPVITEQSNRRQVLELLVSGQVEEHALRELAYQLHDELLLLDEISFVEVANVRDYEISVEVDRDTLTAYGLTLDQLARVVGQNSLELPGGALDTDVFSIPLRTMGRNYTRSDFENIIVLTDADGSEVRLGDVATVTDGFEDTDLETAFNGAPSASVLVYRVGDEQVLEVAQVTRDYVANFNANLPDGVSVEVWSDDSVNLQDRMDILVKNGILGLTLVVICLALFLDFRLAVWCAVGIGIAFAATFPVMLATGMSINMISLFGFILAIGIVVDNAIVVSENVYKNGEQGMPPMEAAVRGTQRIATPVIFSALTTIVAFTPLLAMPGTVGLFLADIPTIVIIVLTLSLFQALFILPRNLSSLDISPEYRPNVVLRFINAVRRRIDAVLTWFINKPLTGILRFSTRRVLVPIALTVALMITTVGLLAHGHVRFNFFPSIDGDLISASIELTDGAAFSRTIAMTNEIEAAAIRAGERLQANLPDGAPRVIEGINVIYGSGPQGDGLAGTATPISPSLANIVVQVTEAQIRSWPTSEFEALWREEVGTMAGLRALTITSSLVSAGDPIALELSVPEGEEIGPIVDRLRREVAEIPGVFALRDDRSAGRLEYNLELREEARLYGLSLNELAGQIRAGFFGVEAAQVQRGRDDVRVFVRLPADERDSLYDLLDTRVRTAGGDLIPLSVVARVVESLGPTEILRRDGRTITTITGDVDTAVVTSSEANAFISSDILPPILAAHPDLIVEFGGEQRSQGDAGSALGQAALMALGVIFALLALAFKSYIQPIVVMAAIPLGLIGAVTGHLILDIPLTLLSIFGIIGLSGVVINNSLVMVDLYNEYLDQGMELREAVIQGTKDRFRPILLTSLTTFLGIFPLILETSLQAQFLIPLAASIGFGVLFGTVIIILAVPALFVGVVSLAAAIRAVLIWVRGMPKQAAEPASVPLKLKDPVLKVAAE